MKRIDLIPIEEPAARAKRLCDQLCGLMKDEIAAYGGTEGFMRWVRHDEQPERAAG